ncbi:MAG: hypothetical protein QM698_16630 [Micropepsaceae bacterium]
MTRPLNPGDPEEKPSWLYPLIVASITFVIGAVILWLYLGPSIDDLTGAAVRPTSESEVFQIVLGERRFDVPGNYIRLPASRRTGPASEVELTALLPDLHGFADGEEDDIRDVTRGSKVVGIMLKAGSPELTERGRFERIYLKNADGALPAFDYEGFHVTPMAADSGYAGQKVFTREDEGHFALIICTEDDNDKEIGGLCIREMAWGPRLTAIYTFRGGRLKEWTEIDAGVKALLMRLEPAASRGAMLAPSALGIEVDVQDRHIELIGRLAVLDVLGHHADEIGAEIDLDRVLDVGTRAQIDRLVAERVAQIGLDALRVLAVHDGSPDAARRALPMPGGSFWPAPRARSSA